MLIGAMHIRHDPNNISRLYALAAAANIEGADFCYFSPGKIDFDKSVIDGFYYEGEWKQKKFRFPDVVINMTGPKTENQIKNVCQLQKYIPFTESKIDDKYYIQELLEDNPIFKNYLPESKVATNKETVMNFIEKYNKAVLKPFVGNNGENIYFLNKDNDHYKITFNDTEVLSDNLDVLDKLYLNDFLVQEFIVSETKEGLPADYRVHTQKDESGNYVITTIYPRIGFKKARVSNLGQGGYSTSIKLFLQNQYKSQWLNVYNRLKILGLQVSEFLDKHYNHKLNQLGIDICIDKNKNLYIIEANWRPGLKVLFSDDINHIKNLIKYCKYIANN